MNWVKHTVRFFLVTVGIIVLTSFGVDATQYLNGSQSALSIMAERVARGECPDDMQKVTAGGAAFCVDTYEASASASCVHAEPKSVIATAENITNTDCQAVSVEAAKPWRYATYHQAKELCARAGKQLITHQQWYEAALGTSEAACHVSGGGVRETGVMSCVSGRGVHDMVGNVWEWIDATVVAGAYDDRMLPAEGYVSNVDTAGVATETTDTEQVVFHNDYFWSAAGDAGMMRGGFFGSGSDAGIYSVQASVATNFAGDAVGFRCALDM